MHDGGSDFRPELTCPSGRGKLPVGAYGAQVEDAYLDVALSQGCQLQRSAYPRPLRTYWRRDGNPVSGGGHR